MEIGVIGAGKWGSALHFALREKGFDAKIHGRTPKPIEGFCDLETILKCDYLIISLPTQITASWLKNHFRFLGQKILVASKGIEVSTGRFLNEIYEEYVPSDYLAFLSGPSFAKEVMESKPTAVVISAEASRIAEEWMGFFPSFIKPYRSDDIKGAEISGAYKNVIAIASGVCDALALGNNARAALLTRGLAEMNRFGSFFGAQQESFLGLSGVGDLFLTASSTLSRNYRVGFGLGSGKSLAIILDELGEVAEGVPTAEAICRIAQQQNIYTPIAQEVQAILTGKNPKDSIAELLIRRQSTEF